MAPPIVLVGADNTNDESFNSRSNTALHQSTEDDPLFHLRAELDSSPPAMGPLKDWLSQIRIPVYFLVMFYAISSWIDINGLWVEVPLLVNELPESWNLPSYLVIIIQVANIGPLVYTVANRIWPHKVKEWPVVYVIIGIGALACLLLSFFWKETSTINGNLHSTALLTLTTCLSLVDCTSSVVYLPYMAGFKPQYMSAFYIGEGLGGLIPGLVGLIQGTGKEPTCVNFSIPIYNATTGINTTDYEVWPVYDPPVFSVEVFFYFLFGMICLSALSFTLLHFLPYCQQEKIDSSSSYLIQNSESTKDPQGIENPACDIISITKYGTSESSVVVKTDAPPIKAKATRDDDGKDTSMKPLSAFSYGLLLFLCAWANGLSNGVIPSTQSYTCLPYGNLAYTLAVRLSTVANPLACFIALFAATNSVVVISVLTAIGTALAGFQLYLAAMSPAPPLQYEASGEAIVVSDHSRGSNFFFFFNFLK